MKSKEEFKERFKNGEFEEDLKNISSKEEFVDFARELGYALSMVAGGKNDKVEYITENKTTTNNSGTPAEQRKGNTFLDARQG